MMRERIWSLYFFNQDGSAVGRYGFVISADPAIPDTVEMLQALRQPQPVGAKGGGPSYTGQNGG
jgi:hypothetical protein